MQVFVGIHVRRTDYKNNLRRHTGHFATIQYFVRAMTHFEAKYGVGNVVFIVASDDYEWCQKMLDSRQDVFLASRSSEVDFALLTRCNHTIIRFV